MTDKKAIANVLSAMLSAIDSESTNAYQQAKDNPVFIDAVNAIKANNVEDFRFSILFPFEQMIEGLLNEHVKSHEAKFLFKHWDFVESHFERLIERFEGGACCADKSRTIAKHLLVSLITGEKLEFDYNQEYTYHLPKLIFKTQEENILFFKALHRLYYGQPEQYLNSLQTILSKAQSEEK